jgi:hypothetical protein
MDKQLDQLLPLLGTFGFKLPLNLQCDDLATIPPFSVIAKTVFDKAEALDSSQTVADGTNFNFAYEEGFNTLFPNRNDAILKMVNFQNTVGKEAEYYYFCADSFSFPAILAQFRGLGIPIPAEAI